MAWPARRSWLREAGCPKKHRWPKKGTNGLDSGKQRCFSCRIGIHTMGKQAGAGLKRRKVEGEPISEKGVHVRAASQEDGSEPADVSPQEPSGGAAPGAAAAKPVGAPAAAGDHFMGIKLEHDSRKCGDVELGRRGTEMLHHIDPEVAALPEGDDVEYRIRPIVVPPPAKNPKMPPPGAWMQSTDDILGPDSQLAYVQRWVRMVKEEFSGSVKFKVVRNNGSRENLILLLGLKNVFVKQLPNMPKPYVTRLVFDRKHESMALLKRTDRGEYIVMGGCCYRPFPSQGFAEIAFLAISHNEQVRGYGTRLMAHTKEHAKEIKLSYLLTCADNNAVPYFKKQGFSKKIQLPRELWQGYIKDYEGVTLMECKLHDKVNYLNMPAYIKAQKMALIERLKEMSGSHIVYPGIDVSKRGGMDVREIPGIQGIKLLDGSSSPGTGADAADAGGSARREQTVSYHMRATLANRAPGAQEALQKHLQHVLTLVKEHSSAWPFYDPVQPEQTGAYDYYEVIKNPVDLGLIQRRLDLGWYYVTKEIFIADIKRMVENCLSYNGKTHYISELAQSLERYSPNENSSYRVAPRAATRSYSSTRTHAAFSRNLPAVKFKAVW
ncbi:Histone acetyltransferase GCN5 [Porphyridium purpureum]|uniref:Histone acetyltransferase GCN5 n=1 Tax=Porphyridium purpureum TaxID=35688 RepID=A0A5J4YSB4_PORPP|nr:Histone acetyltransferase GCN5 [Porphyridium purpureum]|eukprot:POR5028..scf227_4